MQVLLLSLASLDLLAQRGTQAKSEGHGQEFSEAHADPDPHEQVDMILQPLHQSTVATLWEEVLLVSWSDRSQKT